MIETSCGLPGNVLQHKLICEYLNDLYARKNADYGDSFHQAFLEEGWAMPRILLSDKLNRFKTLSRVEDSNVKDESLRDALIDLANYAIMSVMELDRLTAADAEDGVAKFVSILNDAGLLTDEEGNLLGPLDVVKKIAEAEAAKEKPKEAPRGQESKFLIPRSYAVMKEDGSVCCGRCECGILCDDAGDMPKVCPGCGHVLDYSELHKAPSENKTVKEFVWGPSWQRKEAPNNES